MAERVVIREPAITVRVGVPGLQGPPGAGGDLYHRHDQTVAAATWTINHNFGRRAAVAVFSPGGRAMLAEILHVSDMQALAIFDQPTAGYALCT